MRSLLMIAPLLLALHAHADDMMKFNFSNADLSQVIESYAKATGQKFIFDANLKGKVSIVNNDKISKEEAFAQLSSALASNGFGISKQADVMNVMQARMVQRNLIEVGNTLPPLRPEQMFTWVIELKHANAERINRELRILTSRDGELVPVMATNQILITDWVSNLYRVKKIIEAIDRPAKKAN